MIERWEGAVVANFDKTGAAYAKLDYGAGAIFIAKSVLRAADIRSIEAGARVAVVLAPGHRGLTADRVRLLPAPAVKP